MNSKQLDELIDLKACKTLKDVLSSIQKEVEKAALDYVLENEEAIDRVNADDLVILIRRKEKFLDVNASDIAKVRKENKAVIANARTVGSALRASDKKKKEREAKNKAAAQAAKAPAKK